MSSVKQSAVRRRSWALALAAIGLAALPVSEAAAQGAEWPAKQIRIIVPTTGGSAMDLGGRLLADALEKEFGKGVIVENIAGAGNMLGTAAAVRAPGDGYTLLHASQSAIVVIPAVSKSIPADPSTLIPISQSLTASNTLLVNPQKLNVKTLPELVEVLKKEPGKYNFSSSGQGGLSHLLHELFMIETGTKITHVPFSSSPQATTALLGGHVDLAIISTATTLGQIKAGQLRPIVVMTKERDPELPDVPSLTEFVPGFQGLGAWMGYFAPAGTPRPIIDRLSKVIQATIKAPAAMEKIKASGAQAVTSATPEAFAEMVKKEAAMWKRIAKENNIAVE